MNAFGIKDYITMYKAHGMRLPFRYFFENHLFDIYHKTDTHTWLSKDSYTEDLSNFKDGVLYMSSWSSVVRNSTKLALKYLLNEPSNIQLIDLGCGKGKVLCIWELMFKNTKNIEIVGIEYSKELVDICRKNLDLINANKTIVINEDVLKVTSDKWTNNLLIYMYNPFNEKILDPFLRTLTNKSAIIIYTNPVHSDVLYRHNFRKVDEMVGWHKNATYSIFMN